MQTLAIFSSAEAKELTAGDEALANELTSMLIAELPTYRSDIQTALKTQDKDSLKTHTHKLHGATRCCGTPALRHAANHLEVIINNNSTDHLEESVNLIIHEIDRLINTDPDNLSV